MASTTKVGRNEPCPCGSGRKFKHCCQGKAGRMGPVMWAGIVAMIAVAVFLALSVLRMGRAETGAGPDTTCPPGQVWSSSHGHCHEG